MSNRVNLGNRIGLFYEGKRMFKTVRDWINHDSIFIYKSNYLSNLDGIEHINLGKEANAYLKEVLFKKGHTNILKDIERKRRNYKNLAIFKRFGEARVSGKLRTLPRLKKISEHTPSIS